MRTFVLNVLSILFSIVEEYHLPFKRQAHKMVKHTQTIRRQKPGL